MRYPTRPFQPLNAASPVTAPAPERLGLHFELYGILVVMAVLAAMGASIAAGAEDEVRAAANAAEINAALMEARAHGLIFHTGDFGVVQGDIRQPARLSLPKDPDSVAAMKLVATLEISGILCRGTRCTIPVLPIAGRFSYRIERGWPVFECSPL